VLTVVLGADCQGTLLYFLLYAEAPSGFKSVRDSLSAAVLAWALIMSACCVIQDHLVHIPCGHIIAAADSAIRAHRGGERHQAHAASGPTV
jgi:hypothetical protein